MIDLNILSIPSIYDEIWLIGLRIDPDIKNYDFFTIIFSGEYEDIALNIDNYIIQDIDDIKNISKKVNYKIIKKYLKEN